MKVFQKENYEDENPYSDIDDDLPRPRLNKGLLHKSSGMINSFKI
jgi:hypothetical protein